MESSKSFPTSRRDDTKARAETELSEARKTVQDLALMIEEANSGAKKTQQRHVKSHEQEQEMSDFRYAQVMQEIEHIKRELAKLKLDMKLVLKEKIHADNTFKASSSKKSTLSSAVERIEKEIEELDEEHVLVELARIEAVKEIEAIEAKRKEEAINFQTQLEKVKKKVKEIDQHNQLTNELRITICNVNLLENKLAQAKELKNGPNMLRIITEELELAKTELADIKRDGFNFMASMDVIRNELKDVQEQKSQLTKEEEKVNLIVETLNSKIQKAKTKLESVTATAEKANSIASNLSVTVEHLTAESESAKKEKELIVKETENIKLEITKTESEIELSEERLEVAMEELKLAKSSEFNALEKLKNLIDSTVRARELTSLNKSTITITNFEYEYLTEKAGGAEEIADKKVAAARAWVEALKANEKEILMKIKTGRKEMNGLRLEAEEDEVAVYGTGPGGGRWGQNGVKVVASPRRSMYKSGNMTPGKRARSLLSPATRQAIKSASFGKKREKMTRNLETLLDENDEMSE